MTKSTERARAVLAGADAQTCEFVGEGQEASVFVDGTGTAFKVSHHGGMRLRNEAELLEALRKTPAAKHVPRFRYYDPEQDVIAREFVQGESVPWGVYDGLSRERRAAYDKIAQAAWELHFTAPEYKEEGFVIDNGVARMWDLGFVFPRGPRLGDRLREQQEEGFLEQDPFDVQMDITHAVQENGISATEARSMLDTLEQVTGDTRDMRGWRKEIEWTIAHSKPRQNPSVARHADPTVLEYAKQYLFKGKSIATAAKLTAAKLSGHENMMLGQGVSEIDAKRLEQALLEDLYAQASPDGEHMVNAWMVQHHFCLSDKDLARVEKRGARR